jgi:hypothetical protein
MTTNKAFTMETVPDTGAARHHQSDPLLPAPYLRIVSDNPLADDLAAATAVARRQDALRLLHVGTQFWQTCRSSGMDAYYLDDAECQFRAEIARMMGKQP